MRKILGKMKQAGIVTVTVGLGATLFIQTAKADSIDEPYLTNIQNYTQAILTVVNELPTYLTALAKLGKSFMAADNSSSDPVDWSTNWSNQQSWLSTLSTDALTSEASQLALQQSLLTSFFGGNNISAANPQNMNDLTFSTILGQPLLTPDPRSSGGDNALNYITNASGLGMNFVIPGSGWRGNPTALKNYTQFYNTITSVQTHNGYVLSRMYEDSKTLVNDTSLRKQLITQSSNSAWFTSVISNDLGWVLRQLLLYSSQTFILMDQLVQIQRDMSATLAMTNTLIIANSQMQATQLLQAAQGG
jgi:hypothetical protein